MDKPVLFYAPCEACGETIAVKHEVHDSEEFTCPDCKSKVEATVDENGCVYWNTYDLNGEMI